MAVSVTSAPAPPAVTRPEGRGVELLVLAAVHVTVALVLVEVGQNRALTPQVLWLGPATSLCSPPRT